MDAAKPSLISRNPLYSVYYSYKITIIPASRFFSCNISQRAIRSLPSPRWHSVLRFLERTWYCSYNVDSLPPPMQHIVLEAENGPLRSQLLLPVRAEISYEP